MSPADELRAIVRMIDRTREGVFSGLTLEQIVTLCRAARASEWDVYPDDMFHEQIRAAVTKGAVPQFKPRAPRSRKLTNRMGLVPAPSQQSVPVALALSAEQLGALRVAASLDLDVVEEDGSKEAKQNAAELRQALATIDAARTGYPVRGGLQQGEEGT